MPQKIGQTIKLYEKRLVEGFTWLYLHGYCYAKPKMYFLITYKLLRVGILMYSFLSPVRIYLPHPFFYNKRCISTYTDPCAQLVTSLKMPLQCFQENLIKADDV